MRRSYDWTKAVRGKHFGLKVELAPTDGVDAFEDYAREFFDVVLEASRDDYLITDESLLADVLTEESPAQAEQRLLELYGIDVEAEPWIKLVEICGRMRARVQQHGRESAVNPPQ